MPIKLRIFSVAAAATFMASVLALPSDAAAAERSTSAFPTRPIRFVVPFTPGALNDLLARLIGEQLSIRLGERVIVDNRPGAGTIIGSDLVAKSNPDGHTLLLSSTPLAINPTLYPKMPFDPLKDLAGVTHIGSVPFVIVCHPRFAATSVKELVALARAKPGQLSYGATVAGQIMIEMFKSTAKVDIVHVPYKGLAPAVTDVLGERVHFTLGTYSSLGPHVQAGRLRALAVTSRNRARNAPDVPTIAEAGYKDFDAVSWYGVSVAGGTPKHIVAKLYSEIAAIVQQSAIEKRLQGEGVEVIASSPEAFERMIRSETVRYAKVIREAGIKPE